jgi:hypothetical protein
VNIEHQPEFREEPVKMAVLFMNEYEIDEALGVMHTI